MKIARNILLIVLALFLQTSWVDVISIFDIKPDVVLLTLVLIGIHGGQSEATLLGFFSGFLLDIYNPEWMGANALANSLVGFSAGYSRIGVVAEDVQVQATILFFACLLHDFIYFAIYSFSDPLNIAMLMMRYSLGMAVYTAGLGVVLSIGASHFFAGRMASHA